MYKNLIYIDTKSMSHEEWLEQRKQGIGGSDAGAVIGVNKWRSPYTVYCDKLGKLPPIEDTERMRQGRDLENYVAKRFEEQTGKKVRRKNAIIKNPIYPFALADVDRIVSGENSLLECKTTSELNLKKYKSGEYPDTYYTQMLHYLSVTGADKIYLAVLVFSSGFYVFELERDEEEIAALMRMEKQFWEYVKAETPPPVDYTESTSRALNTVYSESNDTEIDLSPLSKSIENLYRLKEQKKEIDDKIRLEENHIKGAMKEYSVGTYDSYKVTWKNQTRKIFDIKKFARENPNIDLEPYYTTKSSRVFRFSRKDK